MEEKELRELIAKGNFAFLKFNDGERDYMYNCIDGHKIIWYEQISPRTRKKEVYSPREMPSTFNHYKWGELMYRYGKRGLIYNWGRLANESV